MISVVAHFGIIYFCKKHITLNYLAHIYLSGTNPQIQIGNFIGDFVKVNAHSKYPEGIASGILFHRKIDHFTDKHPATRQLKELLQPQFGRYSGIIADMYFDYFLAVHFNEYSDKSLRWFTIRFYLYLLIYYRHLPKKVKNFVFHFIFSDRLSQYATIEGLRSSLEIMSYRRIPSRNIDVIISFLKDNYKQIESIFNDFFSSVKSFAEEERIHQLKKHEHL